MKAHPAPASRTHAAHRQSDPAGKQEIRGKRIGDRYVRVPCEQQADCEHPAASGEALAGHDQVGRLVGRVKRILFGQG